MISPITTLAEQTLTLTSRQGDDFTAGGFCGHIAIIDFATFDTFVQSTIVPFVTSHGGGPTSFPIILLYNVVLADPFVSGTSDKLLHPRLPQRVFKSVADLRSNGFRQHQRFFRH